LDDWVACAIHAEPERTAAQDIAHGLLGPELCSIAPTWAT
jgi:hypothetical protein